MQFPMKDSFIIYSESWELVKMLSDSQKGQLLDALFRYTIDGDASCEDPMVQLVFIAFRQKIDYANARYEEVRAKRSEAGKLGGRPPKANAFAEKQKKQMVFEESKKSLTDTVTVTVTDTVNNTLAQRASERVVKTADFEEAWSIYPRKQGKKAALEAYKRAIKKGTQHTDIIKGIEAYKDYLKRNDIESGYTKQGDTFFRQEAWNDDWSGSARKVQTVKDQPKEGRRIDYDAAMREMWIKSVREG